jgi:biotin carboxylase
MTQRILIFTSKLGYQTRAFADAAKQLGAEVVYATDRCGRMDDPWGDGAIPLHFDNPQREALEVIESFRSPNQVSPVAILALGDKPVLTAAHVARMLAIPFHSPEAVENCRTKLRQREVLRAAGLPVPDFVAFSLQEDLSRVVPRVKFPCVVKPLSLAASQGVIRANNAEEFAAAVFRICALLESPEVIATRAPSLGQLLVESYIDGEEVSVEALMMRGELRVLAVFDKPGLSTGPYFEESLYVTPSSHPALALAAVEATLKRAVRALGLWHGPLHCEFRINEDGPWVLEIHPRPIGGLCSRALRFGPQNIFLEELLVRHALQMEGSDWRRERQASGVMMIPVPKSGILEKVDGEEDTLAVPGVEELKMTARLHDYIAAWPEGSSYLGFIFARGDSPESVEESLRAAHAKLHFTFSPRLPVTHPLAAHS